MLFIAPDHYSFYKVVEMGFIKYSGFEVVTILSNGKYEYKNFFEKIKNFFYKNFLKKNLKIINFNNSTFNKIYKHSNFEVYFAIRPDILNEETLKLAQNKSKKSIANYWDSFEKIKGQLETLPYFSKSYSFDNGDCIKYNLNKSTNFYFETEGFEIPEYDVFFLGTFDKRFNTLITILDILNKNHNLNAKAQIFCYEPNDIKDFRNEYVTFIHEIVPFPDAIKFHQNTKIILDVQHNNQVGLSFRPFDCIGMKKKLITTNKNIVNYDFYNENNIFIWTETTKSIPQEFLQTNYVDIPVEIYLKYSLENWVKTILS